MQFQIHSYIHHAKKRCQEPPQFHFKELQSKNPWPTLLGNDFACFLQENKSDGGTKKYLANIRVPIRASCNLLFSFKVNATQLLSKNVLWNTYQWKRRGREKGTKTIKNLTNRLQFRLAWLNTKKEYSLNMLVSFNCSYNYDLSIVLQDRSALIKVFDLFSLWAVKS